MAMRMINGTIYKSEFSVQFKLPTSRKDKTFM